MKNSELDNVLIRQDYTLLRKQIASGNSLIEKINQFIAIATTEVLPTEPLRSIYRRRRGLCMSDSSV